MSTADPNRPLDLSWEEPLPHALTQTRTYLSRPNCSTQVAIVAIHGKGDSARDFADAFVPHLQSYFGSHLQGEVDTGAASSAETESCHGGVRVTLRALEALDGIWFGTHLPKGEDDLAFQGPYVHSSLLKIKFEIESLNQIGVPNSRIILVGFSQGAILINSYLLRALDLLIQAAAEVRLENGELGNLPLPIPAHFLGWAGTAISFETTFPAPGWPFFADSSTPPTTTTRQQTGVSSDRRRYTIWSHQQCGSSDRYFTQTDIEAVAERISKVGQQISTRCPEVSVRSTAELEPGVHSVLPGMTAKLIQMVERAASVVSNHD